MSNISANENLDLGVLTEFVNDGDRRNAGGECIDGDLIGVSLNRVDFDNLSVEVQYAFDASGVLQNRSELLKN